MDKQLTFIVRNGYSADSCVNTDLLARYTTWADERTIQRTDWNKVRHLHILGSSEMPIINVFEEKGIKAGCYVDSTKTWMLIIGPNEQRISEYLLRCAFRLAVLTIGFTQLEEVDVSRVKRLKDLDLSNNARLCRVKGLSHLKQLRVFWADGTAIEDVLDLNSHTRLERLCIKNTAIREIRLNSALENLKALDCNHTEIQDVSFVSFCSGLVTLNLGHTLIKKLPDSIRFLKNLRSLGLQGLSLEELPEWLPDLELEFNNHYISGSGIDLQGTVVKGVDMSIFAQP